MSEIGKGANPVWLGSKDEMIQKLKALKMYEPGSSEQEMKEMLTAVKESQDYDRGGGGNNNFNKTPEMLRPDNQPSHSRQFNSKNSNLESISPELGENVMRNVQSRNSFSKENKHAHLANINKSGELMNQNFPESIDNKHSGQRPTSFRRNNETSKNIIDQMDFSTNTKDVRLQPVYRTLLKEDCAEARNRVNITVAIPRLMGYLHKNANSSQSQQETYFGTKFPWGKAIQVDTDIANEDKESVSDTTWPIAGPSGTNINLNSDRARRACARKNIDYTFGGISGSNSDDDFEDTPFVVKKKSTKRASSPDKTNPQENRNENSRKRRSALKKDNICILNEEKDIEIEDDEENEETGNVKRKKLTGDTSSSENANTTEESVNSESTKRRSNAPEKKEISSWDAIIDEDDDDDDNDDDDTEEKSKKTVKIKKSSTSEAPAKKVTRTTKQKKVESSTSHEVEGDDDSHIRIDDSDEIAISDSEVSCEPLQKSEINVTEEAVTSTSSSVYPRRIVPPNPIGRWAGIRERKPLINYCNRMQRQKQTEEREQSNEADTRESQQKKSHSGMSQSEIVDILEIDDENAEVSVPIEIRPLRISDRMKIQQEHLKNLRKKEQEVEFQRAEEQRIKEAMEQRAKAEKIRQRLKEEKEKTRCEELSELAKTRSEIWWNSMLNQQKKRPIERTELNPDGPRRNSDAPTILIEDNHVETQQNDLETVDEDRGDEEQRVPCPICGKKFLRKRIEDHAASCEEYDAPTTPNASRPNSPVVSTRPATLLRRGNWQKLHKCEVCDAFSCDDGRILEDHVNKCIAKHRDGVAVGPSAVIQVPDSPIRNLRKASELTDSDINYREQIIPKTKSNLNDNRKRKRL